MTMIAPHLVAVDDAVNSDREPTGQIGKTDGRSTTQALVISLVSGTISCFLVANAAENPSTVDWNRVAREALRGAGRLWLAGVVVLSHKGDRHFAVRFLSPDGEEGPPTEDALRCAASLIDEQYGHKKFTLHWKVSPTVVRMSHSLVPLPAGPESRVRSATVAVDMAVEADGAADNSAEAIGWACRPGAVLLSGRLMV
ncbi:hypothetical protein F6X68_01520 [Micromonospora sp. AMSO12t]|uniref:hypothetical protein n=1 Tax=unclassified Micromonospora TaxID=2617518 RepID=UPI00124B5B42|nr:hypothetical protein [Micromonospora sp. AMSO12t]KAB1162088.1 hypothetical protein F6X68_01520 [Micromonospora sp. AMSO12t]